MNNVWYLPLLTCRMKADMTFDGFRAFVIELAKFLRTGEAFEIGVLGIL